MPDRDESAAAPPDRDQEDDAPRTDQPVGDFGDEDQADPGGDSDVEPADEDRSSTRPAKG